MDRVVILGMLSGAFGAAMVLLVRTLWGARRARTNAARGYLFEKLFGEGLDAVIKAVREALSESGSHVLADGRGTVLLYDVALRLRGPVLSKLEALRGTSAVIDIIVFGDSLLVAITAALEVITSRGAVFDGRNYLDPKGPETALPSLPLGLQGEVSAEMRDVLAGMERAVVGSQGRGGQ